MEAVVEEVEVAWMAQAPQVVETLDWGVWTEAEASLALDSVAAAVTEAKVAVGVEEEDMASAVEVAMGSVRIFP